MQAHDDRNVFQATDRLYYPRSISKASEPYRTRGHNKAVRRPDSERLRADAGKTPLQMGKQAFREPVWGPRDGSMRFTSLSSVGPCLRKCHWPGYPPSNSIGGVMGKMIDAQSIVVAAAATEQPGGEGKILRFVLWHSIVLGC